MEGIKSIARKIAESSYLSRWVVLGIDSVLSVFSSMMVYLLLSYFITISIAPLVYVNLAVISLIVSVSIFLLCGTYRGIMRHTTMHEILRLFVALSIKDIIMFIVLLSLGKYIGIGETAPIKLFMIQLLDLVISLSALILLRVVLIYVYTLFMAAISNVSKRVLIYGDDERALSLATYLSNKAYAEYRIVGFVVVEDSIKKLKISGLPVFTVGSYEYFRNVIGKKGVNTIIFPDQKQALEERDRLISFCIKEHVKVMLLPQMTEVENSKKMFSTQVREIRIEDLLGREEIFVNMEEISSFLNNKIVMVTGAAGSIGSELCRLISSFGIKQLLLVDNAETPLHNVQLELTDKENEKGNGLDYVAEKYKFLLADVRNRVRVNAIFDKYQPQIVFHAAAYKHVPMMENNPTEAINVNVVGTKVVADAALRIGVEKMIMVSTDKAVNPTNVMGASKRIAEIYVQSLSKAVIAGKVEGHTKFVTTRFGNVLGSNGSVIPRFREQIMAGGPVTVTHKDIIRYFMTIPEACRLVLEAATMGDGYEIFVFDMGTPVRIADLARNMIALSGYEPDVDIKIKYTGLRPGEKLYEELLNEKELTIETDHKKISIAKVRNYEYFDVLEKVLELKAIAKASKFYEAVKMMKEIVPEFKSQNSVYSEIDKLNEKSQD